MPQFEMFFAGTRLKYARNENTLLRFIIRQLRLLCRSHTMAKRISYIINVGTILT